MPTFESRLRGGLYGLLVGDALGVPYEFKAPSQIPPFEQIEFVPPAGYPRTYASIAPGTWSDDGAQALALLDSLLTCGKLDLNHLATNIAEWSQAGKFAVDHHVFDIGITTSRAVEEFLRGVEAAEAGPNNENSNGNGSLMRVLPLALWHKGSDAELVQNAMSQSLLTHGHPRAQLCCALYCLWARRLLEGEETELAWEIACTSLNDIILWQPNADIYQTELEVHIRPERLSPGQGSGYVVDSLHSARWLMRQRDYEKVVKGAVALGNDTDTTACIAGGIAGIRDGIEAIPTRWTEALRGQEMVTPLLARLLEWRA